MLATTLIVSVAYLIAPLPGRVRVPSSPVLVAMIDESPTMRPAAATLSAEAEALMAAAPQLPSSTEERKAIQLPDIPKSKIRRGDYVVHIHYGVALFEGVFLSQTFRRLENGTRVQLKVLRLKFRDGIFEVRPKDASASLKLFKRKEDVELAYETVKLDAMRSRRSWQKRKERAAKKVWDVAADLVKMYAERQDLRRESCPPDGPRMAKFADAFPYSPTADQERTFGEIEADMVQSEQPMDRLVCGDVGFGKTEVAMRAIYRAVCAGRQVALLAPTTVLAAQHYRSLLQRMPDVRVELLSSLVKRKAAETAKIREEVADGQVDVLVGTHAILSPKVLLHVHARTCQASTHTPATHAHAKQARACSLDRLLARALPHLPSSRHPPLTGELL